MDINIQSNLSEQALGTLMVIITETGFPKSRRQTPTLQSGHSTRL